MKEEEKNEFGIKVVLWVTSFILLLLELHSINTDSHYKYDFFFLLFLLWGVYLIRGRIKLNWVHFLLLAVFLLLHNFGTFGTYSGCFTISEARSWCGEGGLFFFLEYDFYVHGFFGFVSALLLYRTYHLVGPYRGWFMYVAIIAVILGFSAFHEIFEFSGALIVGEGEGVLFVGAGDVDPWDTQKDMFNNLIGGAIGLIMYIVWDQTHEKEPLHRRTKPRAHHRTHHVHRRRPTHHTTHHRTTHRTRRTSHRRS